LYIGIALSAANTSFTPDSRVSEFLQIAGLRSYLDALGLCASDNGLFSVRDCIRSLHKKSRLQHSRLSLG
jgi:hypothetical protein